MFLSNCIVSLNAKMNFFISRLHSLVLGLLISKDLIYKNDKPHYYSI